MDTLLKYVMFPWRLVKMLGDDAQLRNLIESMGGMGVVYVLLFAVIFAETGLVIIPFLPGDSLLFAVGAMGARDIGVNVPLITVLLVVAAVLGDALNYSIGKALGPAVFSKEDSKLLNKQHLLKAQAFYEKHGGKTIILARFVPIVRTFAPFVAGVGRMSYLRFAAYNIIGAVTWVGICIAAGYLFGNIPFVKKNFEAVLIGIIIVSVIPVALEFWKAKKESQRVGGADPLVTATTLGEKPDEAQSRL